MRRERPRSRPNDLRFMPLMVLSGGVPPVPAHGRLSGSLESSAVRRPAVIAAALLGAVALAGCGSQGVSAPTANTVVGPVPQATTFPKVPAFHLTGDSKKGAAVFSSAGCGGCHTLSAAHATGTVGPNLDQLKPDYQAVTAQVTNGGGGMPAFKSSLSTQQIADRAPYAADPTAR